MFSKYLTVGAYRGPKSCPEHITKIDELYHSNKERKLWLWLYERRVLNLCDHTSKTQKSAIVVNEESTRKSTSRAKHFDKRIYESCVSIKSI